MLSSLSAFLTSPLFMLPRDIGLFMRSARTDATLGRLRKRIGSAAAFDALYETGDPWASGDPRYRYQRRKYDVLCGFLPERRFKWALDLGTGGGLLARKLADRADDVLGLDVSQVAVAQAQARYPDLPNLRFAQGDVADLSASLDGQFDLVVLADTLYYLPGPLDDALLDRLATRIARLLSPGGLCLLANHYFFTADPDSRLSRRIHRAFAASPGFRVVSEHRRPFYLASLLARAEDKAAAASSGS